MNSLNDLFYTTNESGFVGYLEACWWRYRRAQRRASDLSLSRSWGEFRPPKTRPADVFNKDLLGRLADDTVRTAEATSLERLLPQKDAPLTGGNLTAIELTLAAVANQQRHSTAIPQRLAAWLCGRGTFVISQLPWHPLHRGLEYTSSVVMLALLGRLFDSRTDWFVFAAAELLHEFWTQFDATGLHRSEDPREHVRTAQLIQLALDVIGPEKIFEAENFQRAGTLAFVPPKDFVLEDVPRWASREGQEHWQSVQRWTHGFRPWVEAEVPFRLIDAITPFAALPPPTASSPMVFPFGTADDVRIDSESFFKAERSFADLGGFIADEIQVSPDASLALLSNAEIAVLVRAGGSALTQAYRGERDRSQIEIRRRTEPETIVTIPFAEPIAAQPRWQLWLAKNLPSPGGILSLRRDSLLLADYRAGAPHYRRVTFGKSAIAVVDYFGP